MKTKKSKLIAILLTAVMVLTMLPAMAIPAYAAGDTIFVNAPFYLQQTPDGCEWSEQGDGWYRVTIREDGTYNVSGSANNVSIHIDPDLDVRLTLTGGVNLDNSGAVNAAAILVGSRSQLTLYVDGVNTLKSGANRAAIDLHPGARLVLRGGGSSYNAALYAYGGSNAPGIGTGTNDMGGVYNTINIPWLSSTTSFDLYAYGGENDAGIGSVNGVSGGSIVIYGGWVYTHGGAGAPGIGGQDTDITIGGMEWASHATICEAFGGAGAAGIGSGYRQSSGKIYLSGYAVLDDVRGGNADQFNNINGVGAAVGSGGDPDFHSNQVGNISVDFIYDSSFPSNSGGVRTIAPGSSYGIFGAVYGTGGSLEAPGIAAFPLAPIAFSAERGPGEGEVTLTWTNRDYPDGIGCTSYHVSWSDGDTTSNSYAGLSSNSTVIRGLNEESNYTFRIKPIITGGYGMEATTSLQGIEKPPVISGETELALDFNYTERTMEYTVSGSGAIDVSKISGDGRITWWPEDMRLTIPAGLPAGSYLVTLRASSTAGNSDFDINITISAQPASVTGVAVYPETAAVRRGAVQQFTAVVSGESDFQQTVTWDVLGENSEFTTIDSDGKLTVSADETASGLIVRATSAFDTAMAGDATVTISDKSQVRAEGVTMSGWVYDGSSHAFDGEAMFLDEEGKNVGDEANVIIRYVGTVNNAGDYDSPLPPVNAGSYRLEFEVSADDNVYQGISVFPFEVSRKTVTVKANDVSIKWGEALPSLTMTIEGFIAPDTAENAFTSPPTPSYSVENTYTAGLSDIYFNLDNYASTGRLRGTVDGVVGPLTNYTLQHSSGTLAISSGEQVNIGLYGVAPPSTYFYKATSKKLSLWGWGFENAVQLLITGPSGAAYFTDRIMLSDFASDTLTMEYDSFWDASDLLTIDLAKLWSFSRYTQQGDYSVRLVSDTGGETARASFKISDDGRYGMYQNGILRVTQKSDRSFGTYKARSEKELEALAPGERVLITVRGDIDGYGGNYTIANNAIFNAGLSYDGEKGWIVNVSNTAVEVKSGDSFSARSSLRWKGVALTGADEYSTNFSLNLSNANLYRTDRVLGSDNYTDMMFKLKMVDNLGSDNHDLVLKTYDIRFFDFDGGGGLKLFKDEVSFEGYIDFSLQVPAIFEFSGDFTLDDLLFERGYSELLLNQGKLPPMKADGAVRLTAESFLSALLIKDNYMGFSVDTMSETLPKHAGAYGDFSLFGLVALKGELVMLNQGNQWIPEKLYLFGSAGLGIPLTPPVVLGWLNGFGGGIDGLASTYFGNFSMIPLLSVKGSAAFEDVTKKIFSMDKCDIEVGPGIVSLEAEAGNLLMIFDLEDAYSTIGLRDPRVRGAH
ncbi:MAG: hypothetical protein FWH55_02105 [Oscillospiraceae bacterium]|nr:hypothetical protein [Oscillospiraceae bacterium]